MIPLWIPLAHELAATASRVTPCRLQITCQSHEEAAPIVWPAGYWSNSSSNLPDPRSEFATVPMTIATPGAESGADSNRSIIFLLGGTDATGAATGSIVMYDAVLDLYNTSLAPMPSPRARLAAAAVDGDTIVAVGGYQAVDAQASA